MRRLRWEDKDSQEGEQDIMGNYKKIDKDDILYIKNTIQDDERVLVGENINEEYSHDEKSPLSVMFG